MSKLIEELKNEHKVLVDTLNEIKNMGITSEEAKKKLFEAKNALLAHLKKEDEELYPVLNKAAENDEELKKYLEIFAKDMDQISKAAMDFFSKYEKESSGIEFAKDFGALMAALGNRIKKEENILYKKYDEIVS